MISRLRHLIRDPVLSRRRRTIARDLSEDDIFEDRGGPPKWAVPNMDGTSRSVQRPRFEKRRLGVFVLRILDKEKDFLSFQESAKDIPTETLGRDLAELWHEIEFLAAQIDVDAENYSLAPPLLSYRALNVEERLIVAEKAIGYCYIVIRYMLCSSAS